MSVTNWEGMFVEASGDEGALQRLSESLEKVDSLEKMNVSAGVELILETWGPKTGEDEAKARFCLLLAEKSCPDSALVRNSLSEAVRKLIPPFLNKSGFIRALGLRDNKTPPPEIARRFKTLLKLKNGVVVFQPESRRWGMVTKIDEFTSAVAISALAGNTSWAAELPALLSLALIFEATPELVKLGTMTKKDMPAPRHCRDVLLKNLLAGVDPSQIKDVASLMLVPELMSAGEFGDWWRKSETDDKPAAPRAPGERRASEARSVQEFRTILSKIEDDKGFTLPSDESAAIAEFFKNLDAAKIKRDELLFAESVSIIGQHMTQGDFNKAISGLVGKCGFLPESPSKAKAECLVVWGEIAARHLPKLVEAAVFLQGEEYMAELALDLPVRCINAIVDIIGPERIRESIPLSLSQGADTLLWMWKNKSKTGGELKAFLNLENVLKAIAAQNLPKPWQASQRDLRKHLCEKADFQKFLMDNAKDVAAIIPTLQKCRAFHAGEQQSLMVKLSRHSTGLREYIEKGDGKNLIVASSQAAPAPAFHPPMTSHNSYSVRVRELEELVNKHIPENQEALKIARSFGDFRENAEYDAAKERRNYLSKRRAELEHDLNFMQRVTFKDIKADTHAALGSSVRVKNANGSEETFHLVGYWDGDPDNNLISYKSKLGESVMNLKAGDKAKLPDGTECVIMDVSSLPQTVVAKLDKEN